MKRPGTPYRAWDAPSAPVTASLHGGIEHNLRKSARSADRRSCLSRRGDSGEGDSHHLDEESCEGFQTGKGSRICRFCSRSPSLMVARRGDREGDSHHLDEKSCDGGQTGGIPNLQILQQITEPHGRAEGRPRRGQSSFGREVLRRRSDRWDPESADFAADHRASWSRGRNETKPMKRPGTPYRAWDAPSAPVPLPLHGGIEHNLHKSAVRYFARGPIFAVLTIGVGNRPSGGFYKPGDA